MTLHHLSLASLVLIATYSPSAWSQGNTQPAAPAAPPAPAASAAAAPKPGPRVVTNTEQRLNSATPGALSPDPKVAPQVSIPLVNTPVAQKKPPVTARGGNAPATGGIDDSAARCDAELTTPLREQCRKNLARPPQR